MTIYPEDTDMIATLREQYGWRPDDLVIDAETVEGAHLNATWGYRYHTVEEAVEILERDFGYDHDLAKARVCTWTAEEAYYNGLLGMVEKMED